MATRSEKLYRARVEAGLVKKPGDDIVVQTTSPEQVEVFDGGPHTSDSTSDPNSSSEFPPIDAEFQETTSATQEQKDALTEAVKMEVDQVVQDAFSKFDIKKLYNASNLDIIEDQMNNAENQGKMEVLLKEFSDACEMPNMQEKKAKLAQMAEREDNPNIFALLAQNEGINIFLQKIDSETNAAIKDIRSNQLTSMVKITSIRDSVTGFGLRNMFEMVRLAKPMIDLGIFALAWNSAQNAASTYFLTAGVSEGMARATAVTIATILASGAYKFRHELEETGKRGHRPITMFKSPKNYITAAAAIALGMTSGKAIEQAASRSMQTKNYGTQIETAVKNVETQVNTNVTTVNDYFKNLKQKVDDIVLAEKDPTKAKPGTGVGAKAGYGPQAAGKEMLFTGKYDEKQLKNPLASKEAISQFRKSKGLEDGQSLSDKIEEMYKTAGIEVAVAELKKELAALSELKNESDKSFAELVYENILKVSSDPTKLPKKVVMVLEKVKVVVEKYQAFKISADDLVKAFTVQGLDVIKAGGQGIDVSFPKTDINTESLNSLPSAPEFSLNILVPNAADKKALVDFAKKMTGNEKLTESVIPWMSLIFFLVYFIPENAISYGMSRLNRSRTRRTDKELFEKSVYNEDGTKRLSLLDDLNVREQVVAERMADLILNTSNQIKELLGSVMDFRQNSRGEIVEALRYKIRESWKKKNKQVEAVGIWAGLIRFVKGHDKYKPHHVVEHNSYLQFVKALEKRFDKNPRAMIAFIKDVEPVVYRILDGLVKANNMQDMLAIGPKMKESFEDLYSLTLENRSKFLTDRMLAKSIFASKLSEMLGEEGENVKELANEGGELVSYDSILGEKEFYAKFRESILRINYVSVLQEITEEESKMRDIVKKKNSEFIRQLKAPPQNKEGRYDPIIIPDLEQNRFQIKVDKNIMSSQNAILDAQLQSTEEMAAYLRYENEGMAERMYYICRELIAQNSPVETVALIWDAKDRRIYLKLNEKVVKVPQILDRNLSDEEFVAVLKAQLGISNSSNSKSESVTEQEDKEVTE